MHLIIGLIAVLVLAGIAVFIKSCLETAKEQEATGKVRDKIWRARTNLDLETLAAIEADNDQTVLRYVATDLANARLCIEAKRDEQDKHGETIMSEHREFMNAPDVVEKCRLGRSLQRTWNARQREYYSHEFTTAYELLHEEVTAQTLDLATDLYRHYLESARALDNGIAFSKLELLLQDFAGELPFPNDWEKLVGHYVSNPSLQQLGRTDKDGWLLTLHKPPTGQLRLEAAEAIRDDNMVLAKVVLAYCNYHYPGSGQIFLSHVEPQLRGELAKVVARHNQRLHT